MKEKFTGRPMGRHGSQTVQRGEPGLAVFIEQLRNALALFVVERGNKTFPQALLRPVANAADKAFKDAHAWQHHLVDDQPRGGPLDQGTRVIVATPAQRIKPSGQAKPGRSIVSEFGKTVTLTDKGEVPFALTTKVKIALEGRWPLLQTEFAGQESRYRAGDFGVAAGKDPKKSGRAQHERETEAIVVTPQPIEDLPIASVQMKILRQLIRGRIRGKSGIALPLLIGQVAGGHIVRNLGLLRRVRGARRFKGIFHAKHLCESEYFSNMFRTGFGGPA